MLKMLERKVLCMNAFIHHTKHKSQSAAQIDDVQTENDSNIAKRSAPEYCVQ